LTGRGAAVLALLLLAACRPSTPPAEAMNTTEAAVTVTHANGLRLDLPKGYGATPQGPGFMVETVPPQAARSAVRVQVALLPEARPMAEARTRELAPGTSWRYAMTRLEATGSGGAEVTLTACRAAGTRWLCLWQTHLARHGEPEFELWAIAAGASAP
jgi:hypothetical protein